MEDDFCLNISTGSTARATTSKPLKPKSSAVSLSKSSVKKDDSKSKVVRSKVVKRVATAERSEAEVEEGHRPILVKRKKVSAVVESVESPESSDSEVEADTESRQRVSSSNGKRVRDFNVEEDPMQFHARPRDLSANSLSHAREVHDASHIFTRTSFSTESLKLDERLVKLLEKATTSGGLGLSACTRIQSVTLPLLNERHNVLMKSQTGSGKTLAYLVPIINDLLNASASSQGRIDGTRALIIAPTRELCSQISDVVAKLTQVSVAIVGGSITGGEKKKSEKARLRKGVAVLVSTPGRLLDHLKTTESFVLNKLRWIVLDEADRLLDMGFDQTILEICSIIRGQDLPGLKRKDGASKSSQSANKAGGHLQRKWDMQNASLAKKCDDVDGLTHVMVSATLTKGVCQLALPVMGGNDFKVVDADTERVVNVDAKSGGVVDFESITAPKKSTGVLSFESSPVPDAEDPSMPMKKCRTGLQEGEVVDVPEQLAQYYMMVTCKWRLAALLSFLYTHRQHKVMVFFATCDSVDYHALLLREAEWPLEMDRAPAFAVKEPGSAWADDSGSWSSAVSSASQSNTLEGMADSSFKGMLGDKCNIFRLHGNIPQKMRLQVYRDFCAASSGVMLCTDVAARGLDLPRVDWILQYDPPCDTSDYVHRAGRTARKGLGGSALIFLLPSESMYVPLLHSHSLVLEPLSLESLFLDAAKFIPAASKFKNVDELTAVILQRRMEITVNGNKPLMAAARQAFRSYIRAYATHSSDTKGIFAVQSLHLGHVAKTFALAESPKTLRNHDDILGKIMNGTFARSAGAGEGELAKPKVTREERDQKYSLSKRSSAGASATTKKSGSRSAAGKSSSSSSSKTAPVLSEEAAVPASVNSGKDKQKLRRSSKEVTPSGKFRKAGGYFRKKLRDQVNGEFSS